MPVALITGATRGLGLALARSLAARDWTLVVDARSPADAPGTFLVGDIVDPDHRSALGAAVRRHGRLDLLVNNASTLGPGLRALARYPLDDLRRVLEVDVLAPLSLVQELLPLLEAARGTVLNVSSDAAVEPYAGWGGYGCAKAALDCLTGVLAVEHPLIRWYSVDPGDMRTQLHQEAYPGEDISDRPEPGDVVPALLRLVDDRPASGRYRAAELSGASA